MKTNTRRTHWVLAAAFQLLLSTVMLAQNTIIPNPVHVTNPSFTWDNTVFATKLPSFALGHQWGTADLDKLNTALRMNVTADHFGYLDPNGPIKTLTHLGGGNGDTNYIVWTSPLMNHGMAGSYDFNGRWLGMRWEPAENSGLGRDWTPRDDDAWPLSFGAKYHGTIPVSSSDANYRRYKLAFNPSLTYPVRVLDSVDPRNWLYTRRAINWANPLPQTFLGVEDTTDASRLQLIVNLRRTDAADNVDDDSVVVSIVVPYQMRWKDQLSTATDYSPVRHRMPFTKVPYTTADSTFDLPQGRGREMKMRVLNPTSEYVDTIKITRRMLPKHSDPGDPDVTIVAEFRTDTIYDFQGDRIPHLLKTGVFNYPSAGSGALGTADSNKRYMAIDTLGITVWYHGTTTPVAIRSASLLTPQTKRATSGYWDSVWAQQMKVHVDSMRSAFNAYNALTGRTYRALAFYTCDEFELEHLLGVRYRLEFLDRRLTTETGFGGSRVTGGNYLTEFGYQKLHGFPSKFVWTSGMGAPDRQIAVPYAPRGFEGDPNTMSPIPTPSMFLKQGYLRGPGTQLPALGEIRIGTDVPNPSYTWFGLPVPDSMLTTPRYEEFIGKDRGAMGWYEHTAYVMMYQSGAYYFAKRRNWWSNFFYHIGPKYSVDSTDRPYFAHRYKVPQTGEWVRLQHGSALALGCRGFMYDKWRYGYPEPPDPDTLNLAALTGMQVYPSTDPTVTAQTNLSVGTYYPGFVCEDATAYVWDTTATVTPDSLLRSSHIGGDYLTSTDMYKIPAWNDLGTMAASMELRRCFAGDSSQKVYIGRKSIQMESAWWHDLVTDTVTQFKRGTGMSNAAIFMKTRPVGWFGKGYKTLTNGDTLRLRKWVDAYASMIMTKRWERASSTDTTLVLREEPQDEHLYDIILMDTSEASVSDDNCILAVTNRRTSPWLFNASLQDSIEFVSSYDFDQLVKTNPHLRYKQVGARQITIPFHYSVVTTRPFLLHVRELRPSYDANVTIDTIVSWNSDLAVDFRPGETRFFQIKRLQATDTLDAGYLAFSTQNKLVAYPVPKSDNSGYTDSIRYHMAYHRRDDDPMRNAWSVFYQRSKPYHRDSLPLVAGLDWESPIRLSGMTMSSVMNTDGLNRTLYNNGVNSVAYLANVPNPSLTSKDCCCGFPSLVIRETTANTPKVYVVYACEDEWATTNNAKQNYFHIVENAFLDQATLNPAILDGNGKSLVICAKNMGHDGGVDTLKSLARYGTPVINASANNNMYYAWSSTAGISAGRKASTQDWFAAANAITTLPQPTLTWYYNHDDVIDTLTIAGGDPKYPSLNVYSNIAQNRTDATLVWEEGATNRHIRYTRLVPGIGTAIARMLPDFVDMSYDTGTPPSIPVDAGNAIAIVGGASVDDEAELPVVVRSLQADTMSMFIRDEDGSPDGLYRYNHETVSWSEYVLTDVRARVRYNHFVDMQGFGANELHYWWANTTYSMAQSLFHPVITNGKVWLDSLTWQGIVDDTLITYEDSLHIVKGNLSDSALVVNYTLLDAMSYADLQSHLNAGYASYWTGQRQFANLTGQQLLIRRMPGIPAPLDTIFDNTYLRAAGPWPHVAMRQRENRPDAIQSVRRILQYTNNDAPDLIASAEQFYKPSEMEETPPATYGGFEVRGQKVTVRGVLSDGRSLAFKPVYNDVVPAGYGGSTAYAWQMASMTTPVSELVSETFRVGDVDEMKLLSTGSLRGDVAVSIEEVDPLTMVMDRDGASRFTSFREPEQTFTMNLAQIDEEKPEQMQKARYYLTSGEDKFYRMRMKYTGTRGVIFREDVDIAPGTESFEKATNEPVRVINLKRMTGTDLAATTGLSIFPNPATEWVTILVGGAGTTLADAKGRKLVMDVADAVGNVILTSPVSFGEAVDVQGLPTGTYVVRVRLEGPYGSTVRASGTFTVVK